MWDLGFVYLCANQRQSGKCILVLHLCISWREKWKAFSQTDPLLCPWKLAMAGPSTRFVSGTMRIVPPQPAVLYKAVWACTFSSGDEQGCCMAEWEPRALCCMHTHVCSCSAHVHAHLYTHMYICAHIHIQYMHVCMLMHACMWMNTFLFVHTRVCMHIHAHTYAYVYLLAHTCTHIYRRNMHMRAIHEHMYTYILFPSLPPPSMQGSARQETLV